MSDLFNNFPSWGEVGEYPQDGFFYDGGDQVNEKHMDALWNGIESHFDNLNTAIRDRVRDLDGNVVLDQGLVASEGSGTREVDVTASSDGAYVDGQRTGSVSADTVTHSTNGTGSTRTDVVWVNTDGSIGKSEDTTTTSSTQLKIAEVDVATDDTISAVRNYARDHAHHVASENVPSNPEPGDLWHDLTNDRLKVRQGGSFDQISIGGDSITINSGDGLNGGGTISIDGGSLTLTVDVSDFAGSGLQDDGSENLELVNDSVTVTAGDGVKGGGTMSLGGSVTINIEPNDFAGSGLQDDGADNLELVSDTITINTSGTITGGGNVSLGGSVSVGIDDSGYLTNSDIASENGSGSQSVSLDSTTTITVSFANTYVEASGGAYVNGPSEGDSEYISGGFVGWDRDGSGNITGMQIILENHGTASDLQYNWNVMGQIA